MSDNKKERVILIGGGGHCLSCIDVLTRLPNLEILGILDRAASDCEICGLRVIGTDDEIAKFVQERAKFLITVGQVKTSAPRERLFRAVADQGGEFLTPLSPDATVSKFSTIGRGSIVLHRAVLNTNSIVKENCIINTGAIIEHSASVGPHSHISTGAVINGDAVVGSRCFIGSGAIVNHGVRICDEVVVGAGATVIGNLEKPGTYVGTPAAAVGR